jgi:hypothetical protein
MIAVAVAVGAGQGSSSFLFLIALDERHGSLRPGFCLPVAATGFQFDDAFFQSPDVPLAFQSLGLAPVPAFLEERKQLVGRTRIRIIFLDGFHEQLLGAHKNRSRTRITPMTKTSFSIFIACF